jgi:hypothetical protein
MKKNMVLLCSLLLLLTSCNLLAKMGIGGGSRKKGCPTDGRNVGAEKLLSGEKIAKAPKFKKGKSFDY